MRKTSIVLVGPSLDHCEGIRGMLAAQPDFEVTAKPVNANDADLMDGVQGRPDILVALFGTDWVNAIDSLTRTAEAPPTIAIGPPENLQLIRKAMQAGVRDYLPTPVVAKDLFEAVRRIRREVGAAPPPRTQGSLVAVINVKGGSGASFIAANLAHVIAAQRRIDVGLLDLDLQFGVLPLLFDLERRSSLLEALASANQLDSVALRGYMTRHDSGVHVLSAMSEQLVVPWDISRDAVTRLLETLRQAFPVTIVDLPRQIDPLTTAVFDQADRVLMVTQQSLAHTRDAKRMQQVLVETLGLPRDRIVLLVNRFNERQAVRGRDIQDAVSPPRMVNLPNDFATVSEALDIGVPVYAHRPDSAIAKGLLALADELGLTTNRESARERPRGLRAALAGVLKGATP